LVAHLVESGQKDATHEARENYPETVAWKNLLFIHFPGRSGISASVFLFRWRDYFARGIGRREAMTTDTGEIRHRR